MTSLLTAFAGQVSTWGRKIGPGRFVCRTLLRQFTKRILRRDQSLVLANGRTVCLPRGSGFSSVAWIMEGRVDDGCETVLHGLHRPGTAFCDIGAHFGFYAVWMSDCASVVYAFEPDPRMLPSLRRNLDPLANGQIVAAALSGKSGRVTFIQAASAPHSKVGAGADAGAPDGTLIEVPALSLDDFWRAEGCPAVGSMKIDTEGHEASVLGGAMECIAQCRPLILVETESGAMPAFWSAFAALGYRVGLLDEMVGGVPSGCWFGALGEVPFKQGMLFLVPPSLTEADFRREVDGLGKS